jgi:hypothetical protein
MNDKIGRNDLCLCGSGKKYKKCCLQNSPKEQPFSPKFRFEPGSYGGTGRFMPSMACLKQKGPDEWDYHFVLVKQNETHFQEDNASSQAKKDLGEAFTLRFEINFCQLCQPSAYQLHTDYQLFINRKDEKINHCQPKSTFCQSSVNFLSTSQARRGYQMCAFWLNKQL